MTQHRSRRYRHVPGWDLQRGELDQMHRRGRKQLDNFTLGEALSAIDYIKLPVGNTQGEDPACGRTPANGAAEGISPGAEPQDLDSRAVLPSSLKPPALRRREAPEPSLPCQSEADLPASMTSQEHGHRN